MLTTTLRPLNDADNTTGSKFVKRGWSRKYEVSGNRLKPACTCVTLALAGLYCNYIKTLYPRVPSR
jgi:hypothetical protein